MMAVGCALLGAAATAAFFLGKDFGEWSGAALQESPSPSTAQAAATPAEQLPEPQQAETASNTTPVVKATGTESPIVAVDPPSPPAQTVSAVPAEKAPESTAPAPAISVAMTPEEAVQIPTPAEPPTLSQPVGEASQAAATNAPSGSAVEPVETPSADNVSAGVAATPAPAVAPAANPPALTQSEFAPLPQVAAATDVVPAPEQSQGKTQDQAQDQPQEQAPDLAQDQVAVVAPAEPESLSEPAPESPQPAAAAKANSLAPGQILRDCANCPELAVVMADAAQTASTIPKLAAADGLAPFAIGRFEITFDDWAVCVAAKGCAAMPADEGWGAGARPVIHVSHEMITQQYLPWLSQLTGKSYRLPSAQEWDLADALGGTAFVASQAGCAAGNFSGADAAAQGCVDPFPATAPAGAFQANTLGIFDLRGNVWEWVEDCWSPGFTYKVKPREQDCRKRRLRGGSWNSKPQVASTPAQGFEMANRTSRTIGFRVARSLP
jgi:hypothetical protein